ncbi:geranylgeranyl reductase family protein [Fulvivirga sp. RKSG066]|uniref:NAD(P)/FAD-dependent oxidoreductase n=1 Tax=Fulvivirga aurantia TaxID=2529383 RepID=UPI0012BB81C4|nr:geranylgeranyl reductase family protein [Fulvivirga aurantia]MTI21718.1 geranylgeranyl reductase family protein [Fulvivirga aurantia]
MEDIEYDIIIVGAGPAGCACAYQLRNEKLKIALIDKATFPRDKICGDALSADVINQLYRMDERLAADFESFGKKIDSHGVRFVAPNSQHIDIDFANPNHGKAAGYISKRIDFDQFLFDQVKDQSNLTVITGQKVDDIKVSKNSVELKINNSRIFSKLIIGADGAHSIVNKKLGQIKVEKNHYCAGIRCYYDRVSQMHPKNHIELHFYDDVLPGYLWIFPLPNGQANVGLGMLSSEVSMRKINLKQKLEELVKKHPNLINRFENAEPMEKPQGFGLPIGSKKRPLSGDRFLLLGDAASLIDPFTGEGIGNALRSGRIAAEHIVNAIGLNDFSKEFNKRYDKVIYQKMWNELRISRSMQKLLRYPKLFNFVVKKANKNASVRTLLTSMLDNVDLKKELIKPSFYFKLLFS